MHENEVIVFLLSTSVLGFIYIYRKQLKRLPAVKWLYASFFAAWLAWLATILEHFLLPTFFNLLEHAGYALNGVLLFMWCWLGVRSERGHQHD